MVNTPALYEPDTPGGNPLTDALFPEAPTLNVIFAIALFIHTDWLLFAEVRDIVAFGFTVIVPDADVCAQVPVVVAV